MKYRKQRGLAVLAALAAALCLAACSKEPEQTLPATTPEQTVSPTTPAPTTMPEIPFSLALDPSEPIVVWEESLLLSGTADPRELLTAGGQPVEVSQDGSFSCRVSLALGSQTVQLRYKGESYSYQVERRYAVQSITPLQGQDYCAGQTMFVQVMAREGSQVEVSFMGSQVPMQVASNQLGLGAMEGFVLYAGQVKMPEDGLQSQELGTVSYRVSCDGNTETWESGPITCQAAVEVLQSDPSVTPEGYWDVGSGFIVELVGKGTVETFSGRDNNDLSRPTNNYLPVGTVDYADDDLIYNSKEGRTYRALRCGVRVYAQTKNNAFGTLVNSVDGYYGTLPDHNEIAIADFAVEGHHTYLTLDCLWKAPFFFDYEEQEYENERGRLYYVEKFDARYVDIRFCYADRIEGALEIPADHPLFASAEIIQNTSDYTLRLWLKKEGGLYGWDAYYNENDQLVFRFLNPVTVTQADNNYGADLTGVTILLDVGHGGADPGACGHDGYGKSWPERDINMELALLVKAELESLGARVVLNRTDNEMEISHQERILLLQALAPDYCLSIHHNSSVNPKARGYESCFYTTFSQHAAELVEDTVWDTHAYSTVGLRFYLYYYARQTTCPVVLTEGGYLSNREDLNLILSSVVKQKTARALTQGVVNYFLEMSGLSVSKG